MKKQTQGRVRIVVRKGHDRHVVFDEEVDVSKETQLRKKAEEKMGTTGLAVMSISRSNGTEKEANHVPAS